MRFGAACGVPLDIWEWYPVMNALNYIVNRESALPVVLTGRQMSMVAFGTVISYGLVSGSAFPLLVAGSAAVPAYMAAGLVALLLMVCLGSMVAQRATPGAFGSYAECHLGPATGFLVRAAYLASLVLIIGTEVSLLTPVLAAWLPHANTAAVLSVLLAGLVLVNLGGARTFAHCEVALSAFKILSLIALIALAVYHAAQGFSVQSQSSVGFASSLAEVPFVNIWQAFMLATLGFVGIESLAIVAAETKISADGLRCRLRVTTLAVVGLALAAAASASALVQSGAASLSQPPFGTLLGLAGLPWPNTLFRVLVLVTILSVLNSQIYCASRMLFSMARAGQAPVGLGRTTARGPVRAVMATGALSIVVLLLNTWQAGAAYVAATAIATTGLLFVWLAIFLASARHRMGSKTVHLKSRTQRCIGAIAPTAGALVVVAIAGSTLAIDEFVSTLHIGVPFMLLLWLGYAIFKYLTDSKRSRHRAPANAGRPTATLLVE